MCRDLAARYQGAQITDEMVAQEIGCTPLKVQRSKQVGLPASQPSLSVLFLQLPKHLYKLVLVRVMPHSPCLHPASSHQTEHFPVPPPPSEHESAPLSLST